MQTPEIGQLIKRLPGGRCIYKNCRGEIKTGRIVKGAIPPPPPPGNEGKPNMIRGAGKELKNKVCTICGRLAMYPCSDRNDITVLFKVENRALLIAALKALNWTYEEHNENIFVNGLGTIDMKSGQVRTQEYARANVNALKQAYALEVLKNKTKSKGWILRLNKTDAGATTGQIVRY